MKTIFLIIGLLLVNALNAQSTKVYGKVVDADDGGVPGATVMLIGQTDSILKAFAVSDEDGRFMLQNIKPDTYIFKASFYGYEPVEIAFSTNEFSLDTTLGTVVMTPRLLDVVNINADYIPIQIKGDTIEYDSRAFETGEHDVVENLLEQLPGVEVMEDGTIKVQGKVVEKILVDGEAFFGNDPTIATKNLPAEAVDKVQVFEKDSDMASFTGVEDGQETTTINLKLKEEHKKGYFGNAEIGYGDAGESFNQGNPYKLKGNAHYFKNKWQVSAIGLSNNVNETGFSLNDYIGFMGGIQNLVDGNGAINLDTDQGLPIDFGQNTGFLNTNALGFNLNYKPSKKATFSSSAFFNTFDKKFNREIDRTTFFQDSSLYAEENRSQNNISHNNRVHLHYKQEFDTTHFLNIDLVGQWTNGTSKNGSKLLNYDSQKVLKNNFYTQLNQDRITYNGTLMLDYRKKFKQKGTYLGTGFSYGIDNNVQQDLLSYQNTFYGLSGLVNNTDQTQYLEEIKTGLNGNVLFSKAMYKKNLVQFEVRHERKTQARSKEVLDVLAPDNLVLNSFFSGNAVYQTLSNQIEVRHKYISKKWKTTIGINTENLHLNSENLFTKNNVYNYLLPFVHLEWVVSKSADLRLGYGTRTNAPNLGQLQALPDNRNPAEVVNGNTNLIPEYIQDLSLNYNYFNEFNFTFFLASVSAMRVNHKINYAQMVQENFVRIFTPENNGIENQINSSISFGTNLNPLKMKFSIENNSNVSQGQLKLNGVDNKYTSFYNNAKLTVENRKKKRINIRASIGYTYSVNQYEENMALNGSFFSWNYTGNITWKVKDKWELNTNAKHHFYPSFTTNNAQFIMNASIARNVLKSKKLQIYLAAFDLFNKNTGINQAYFLNYYEQERIATLARYFMVGVKYSFRKLGA